MKILLICIILILTGCGQYDTSYDMEPQYSENNPAKLYFSEIIVISNQFSEIEKDMIEMAIGDISFSTNGVAKMSVYYDNDVFNSLIEKDDTINNIVSIIPISNYDILTSLIDEYVGAEVVGYYNGRSIFNIKNTIYIVSDRISSDIGYVNVIIHELLHSAGVSHINKENVIMNPHSSNTLDCITKTDLEQFCSLYNCDIKNMNYCNADREYGGVCRE